MLRWSKFLILALFLINSIFVKADANKFSSSNVVVENFKCLPEKNSRFDPNTASSLDNLYMMMLASWLAHEKKSESRREQLHAWGFNKHVDLLRDTYGHRAYVAINENYVLLVFRGTQTANQYISNALFYQMNFSRAIGVRGAKTHRGMAGVFVKYRKRVFKAIEALNLQNKPIILAGHSLGGVMATFFGYKLQKLGYNVRKIYTAGQPKLGNSILRNAIENQMGDKIISLSLNTDITPMVPPAKTSARYFSDIISAKLRPLRYFFYRLVLRLNYEHNPGKKLVLTRHKNTGEAYIEQDTNSNRREVSFWKDISARLSKRSNMKEISDYLKSKFDSHHPDNYICGLTELMKTKQNVF